MILIEPHKAGSVTELHAVRQGRVVSRMHSDPEQEWAGEVALAFEIKVWGCGQLFTAPWASCGGRNVGGF